MLSDLFEVDKRISEPLAYCRHPPQRRSLELFALIKRLPIFQKSHIVPCDSLAETLGGGHCTERALESVGIVKGVEEVFVEWVYVLQSREGGDDCLELLSESLCGVFDLSDVEAADSSLLESGADLGGQATLCSAEDDVDELL